VRLAWFRPTRAGGPPFGDDLGDVITALRATHAITIVDRASAHDAVWQFARGAFDLAVYELDDTRDHAYVWAYLLNYPGVAVVRAPSIHASRAEALLHHGRAADYAAELDFSEGRRRATAPWHVGHGAWPFLRVPMAASRMTVVGDAGFARELASAHPGAAVRYVPIGTADPRASAAAGLQFPATRAEGPLTVAVVDGGSETATVRAVTRARAAGANVVLRAASESDVWAADVVVALRRPALGVPIAAALRGMSLRKPVIVAETAHTAPWPALDPQTWQPRGFNRDVTPIAVSLDPRDEEHSLFLALQRLASDRALRITLGEAAHAWWQAHATATRAAAAWEVVLADAMTLDAPAPPAGWPAHLGDDGTARARAILAECGVTTDLF
jgi:hypothetical protein